MKIFRWIWLAFTVGLLGYAFYQGMYVAPTEATMGDIQRIFYYHFPSAMMTFLFFFISFAASIVYLASRRNHPQRALNADAAALAAAEMGMVFCTLVLIQGPLWARPVWGIWWTWDARLTSTLVLWLIYASYLLLRKFADGPQMQTVAAVLAVFGYVDVPIVYFSTRWWRTQHPAPGDRGRQQLRTRSFDVGCGFMEPGSMACLGTFDSRLAIQHRAPQTSCRAACCPARSGSQP